MPDLNPLLSPDSIAIVGASADTETLRGRLTHAMIGHGYDGRVFPVTRSQSEVLGLRAYPSVAALPEPVDLAVIWCRRRMSSRRSSNAVSEESGPPS
jgi:acyl-CoA synthetase (NDP forming)